MDEQRWKVSEPRREEDTRSEKRKSEKKDNAGRRKGRKVENHCVYRMICSGGCRAIWPDDRRKVARSFQLWRETHFAVKMYKTHQNAPCSEHFWDAENLYADGARSAFRSKNLQSLQSIPTSEHFWKMRSTKHTSFGTPLKVEMLKRRTPL